jgi:uncharacterized protein
LSCAYTIIETSVQAMGPSVTTSTSVYLQPLPPGAWTNEVTVRSGRLARMYEPGAWIARVSPTPLLMIVALADHITLTDLELRAYAQAFEPKKLVTVNGRHADPHRR